MADGDVVVSERAVDRIFQQLAVVRDDVGVREQDIVRAVALDNLVRTDRPSRPGGIARLVGRRRGARSQRFRICQGRLYYPRDRECSGSRTRGHESVEIMKLTGNDGSSRS